MTNARKSYAFIYRSLALAAFVIYVVQTIGVFSKAAPPRRSLKHGYLWIPTGHIELTRWKQFQVTFGKVIGSLSSDPIVTGTIWDVLLTGLSLSIWAVVRNMHVKAILQCLGLANWKLKPLNSIVESSLLEEEQTPESPTRKRGRARKGLSKTPTPVDGDYIPSLDTLAQVKAHESLALSEDDRENNTEAGVVAWPLFFIAGLGTTLSAVLGGELSGS